MLRVRLAAAAESRRISSRVDVWAVDDTASDQVPAVRRPRRLPAAARETRKALEPRRGTEDGSGESTRARTFYTLPLAIQDVPGQDPNSETCGGPVVRQ